MLGGCWEDVDGWPVAPQYGECEASNRHIRQAVHTSDKQYMKQASSRSPHSLIVPFCGRVLRTNGQRKTLDVKCDGYMWGLGVHRRIVDVSRYLNVRTDLHRGLPESEQWSRTIVDGKCDGYMWGLAGAERRKC